MTIKLLAMTYGKLTSFVQNACKKLPDDVEVVIKEGVFSEIDQEIQLLVQKADVILSSGFNAKNSFWRLSQPCISVVASGFDLMLALERAIKHTDHVAVLTFEDKIPEIAKTAEIFRIQVEERVYNSVPELEETLRELQQAGFGDVIGTSQVVEQAKKLGMRGYLIYSERSVENALDTAIIIARSKKKEQDDANWLSSILEVASEAIVAIDKQGIVTLFNQCAEKILGMSREQVCGCLAKDVFPAMELQRILVTKKAKLNQIQTINNAKVLTNSIPIFNGIEVIGALGAFQSVAVIQKAEAKIRSNLYAKGFVARIHFDDLLGTSRQIKHAKEQAQLYAQSNSTVMITGESGCGKDLFAQSIHNASAREKKPFVAVNCAAFPPSLLESELFGYEEGAFTGARRGGKQGVFELAHGGTIFLDEIGEISLEIQARLLRVLEQKEILRIGSEHITPVDIRIIAATNKNLWGMVQKEKFRNDLYYRLNVLELKIPSLKERPEDIPLLLHYFLSEYCTEMSEREIDEAALNPVLREYEWPGNVRELKNVAERFAVLSKNNTRYSVQIHELIRSESHSAELMVPIQGSCDDVEVLRVLKDCRGNRTRAAEQLGMSRTTLWRKLREIQAKV